MLTVFPGDATAHSSVAGEQHDMTLTLSKAGLLADALQEIVALAGQAREEVHR